MLRVLVLDDDSAVLSLLKSWLNTLGCQSFTASSVEEAAILIQKNRFNLILVDKNLSNFDDGLEFIYQIKHLLEETTIILMSADPIANEEGFAFIEKPFDFEVLKSIIIGLPCQE